MWRLPSRILILGMGRSGEAVAAYLATAAEAGEDVDFTLCDEADGPELRARARALAASTGAEVVLDATAVDGTWDLVVTSPGIPPHSALMSAARALGVPVISELEFAFRRSVSPFVAVTGTNGKTTTTALITHLLGAAGIPAESVGNIGTAVAGAIGYAGPESVLVAEVSSFQLAGTVEFHPRVAVLLNITPDHLDWHGSLADYEADKARIFANLGPDDTAVIDSDDPGSTPWAERVAARGVRVVRVSRHGVPAGGAGLADGALCLDGPEGLVRLIASAELAIRGEHNLSNALAAAAAASAMGAAAEALREGLRTFLPIAHRLEPVGVVAGVEYFNDSKATNPDAVLKALTAFDERPALLLLGGRNKGNDFGELARVASARCRTSILYGEAAPALREAFTAAGGEHVVVATLAEAFAVAARRAVPGDVVLLSPACASFDQFRSYEHRGDAFKSLVAARLSASAVSDPGHGVR